jgi:hypothetical protein
VRWSPILAFRPAGVVERLAPRSEACALSTAELLDAAHAAGRVLPLVHAPVATVARGALVAAREAGSALGLQLSGGVDPARWFAGVTGAADEVAAGLPLFLAAEVVVSGEGATQVDAAVAIAWKLVDAGLTHLAVDASAAVPGERARVIAAVAEPALARGIALDVVLPLADAAQRAARAAATLDGLARIGVRPDLASVRCPAAPDADGARAQAGALARVAEALRGTPVMRRGPVTAEVLAALRGGPVRAVSDGGAATARAIEVIPWELLPSADDRPPRASELEAAVLELSEEGLDRMESQAYVEASELIERLGARGSARAVTDVLEARLREDAGPRAAAERAARARGARR